MLFLACLPFFTVNSHLSIPNIFFSCRFFVPDFICVIWKKKKKKIVYLFAYLWILWYMCSAFINYVKLNETWDWKEWFFDLLQENVLSAKHSNTWIGRNSLSIAFMLKEWEVGLLNRCGRGSKRLFPGKKSRKIKKALCNK